jgi:hypothetical protein
MNGMNAARKIRIVSPNSKIIFVSRRLHWMSSKNAYAWERVAT